MLISSYTKLGGAPHLNLGVGARFPPCACPPPPPLLPMSMQCAYIHYMHIHSSKEGGAGEAYFKRQMLLPPSPNSLPSMIHDA